MKVAGFAGIAFIVGSALAGCSAPATEAVAPAKTPVAPVTAPATVQAKATPAPVVVTPKAAPVKTAPTVHAAAIPATPAKTVAAPVRVVPVAPVAPAKRYVPCSAVGMVADSHGVCHAAVPASVPGQNMMGAPTGALPVSAAPKAPSKAPAKTVAPTCNPLPLGSGGAVTGATIEQRWAADFMGSKATPVYKLCSNDPAMVPTFDTMHYASDGPINGVWILFTSPSN